MKSLQFYHFIIKELATKFEGKFECLREDTKKYKTFFVLIEKEVTNHYKDGRWYRLILQDLWKFNYEILLIISQKEFTKLNVKMIAFLTMKVSKKVN